MTKPPMPSGIMPNPPPPEAPRMSSMLLRSPGVQRIRPSWAVAGALGVPRHVWYIAWPKRYPATAVRRRARSAVAKPREADTSLAMRGVTGRDRAPLCVAYRSGSGLQHPLDRPVREHDGGLALDGFEVAAREGVAGFRRGRGACRSGRAARARPPRCLAESGTVISSMRTMISEIWCSQANHGSSMTSCSSAPGAGHAAAIHFVLRLFASSSSALCRASRRVRRSLSRARIARQRERRSGMTAPRAASGAAPSSSSASTSSRSVIISIDPSGCAATPRADDRGTARARCRRDRAGRALR